jgi:hypothetical protein
MYQYTRWPNASTTVSSRTTCEWSSTNWGWENAVHECYRTINFRVGCTDGTGTEAWWKHSLLYWLYKSDRYHWKEFYPLLRMDDWLDCLGPRIDDLLNCLGEAQIFSTLDANAGYWQVKVAKKDWDQTSFTCHAGTYQFKRMPFGLVNAPSTF